MVIPRETPVDRQQRLWLCVGICLAVLLVSYVTSYAALSRRGIDEWSRLGLRDGWFYVPLKELHAGDPVDWNVLNQHHALRIVFLPLHQLDVLVFGTPPPHRGGTWGLSFRNDVAPQSVSMSVFDSAAKPL